MWLYFVLLFAVASTTAEHQHAWNVGKEYKYLVRSRTLATWTDIPDRYTGILMKGILTIQASRSDTLRAELSRVQYAQLHTDLLEGWESDIPDRSLEYDDLPISKIPFEIMVKHGVVRDLIVDESVPTWEVNVLKSIVSQLQVDTQGENSKMSRSTQVPMDGSPYAMFRAMEDSVGGKCEVLYDIMPLEEHVLYHQPELVPLPDLRGYDQHIDIMKTKNYSKCEHRVGYHFGVTGKTNWEPGSNDNGRLLSKSSTSRIVISGTLKRFTIQSSVTINKVVASPKLRNDQFAMIMSKMNLTLASVNRISEPLQVPLKPRSMGNLVYTYNEPFSQPENRRVGKSSVSPNSAADSSSSSISSRSSSEEIHRTLDLSHSSSDSKSSSSISSSEEGDFWQIKPKIDEAPNDPLLPYFIGFKGRPLWMSEKIDPIKSTRELVREIAVELEEPSDIPDKQTLEKFTILSWVLRTMSKKQIEEAEGDMYRRSKEETSDSRVRRNSWSVFRDAIAQTGTGPALMVIKGWIRSKKIEGMVAADVVSRIPDNARMPTSEYMDELFSLVKDPKVLREPDLNVSSVLAFTDLLRRAQINNGSVHNRYPVHAYGRLISKHSPALFHDYIPFLSEELKNAVANRDSRRIQVFTLALGNLGHPAILRVFEPYLEGKVSITDFQRLMMVASLSKLADLYPKLARAILYKIYVNSRETYEIRCMAVYLLMKTNPPLNMLQRMAQFTNYDRSANVNSAVKSSIESAAKLRGPEWQSLARNARIAQALLSPKEYSYVYSHSYIHDSDTRNENLCYDVIVNYIGSDDTVLPRSWYIGLDKYFGGFRGTRTEMSMMVSSMRRLLQAHWIGNSEEQKDDKLSKTEQLARMLNIIPSRSDRLEGNFFLKSEEINRFISFDENSLRRLTDKFYHFLDSLRSRREININRLSSYEVTISYPLETGLPFVYSTEIPILLKFSGKMIKMESEFRAAVSKKIQSRIGFITPFNQRYFIAGVDTNAQVYGGGKLQFNMNLAEKQIELKLRPDETEKKGRLFHLSVIPFTSRHDLLDLSPVSLAKDAHPIHGSDDNILTKSNDRFLALTVEIEAGEDLAQITSFNWKFDLIKILAFPSSLFDTTYRKINVYFNPQFGPDEWVTLRVSYDKDTSMTLEERNDWESVNADSLSSVSMIDSKSRKERFLKDAAKGIISPRSYVLDLELEIPTKMKNRQVLTAAVGTSTVDPKVRVLLYWGVVLPDQEINYEACATAQSDLTTNPPSPNFEQNLKSTPTREFNLDIRFGRTCSEGERVEISGKQMQSTGFKEELQRSPAVKKCLNKKEGSLRTCQKVGLALNILDQLDITVKFDPKFSIVKIFAIKAIEILKQISYPKVRVDAYNPKHFDDNRIDVRMKLQSNLKNTDVTFYMANTDVTFQGLEMLNRLLMAVESKWTFPSCLLGNREIATFDDRTYRLDLGKCDHVLMTTYPRGENVRIPDDMRVSIVARGLPNGKKEITLMLGNSEIRLSSSESEIITTVNGKRMTYDQVTNIVERQDDEVLYDIFQLPNGETRIVSDKYQVDIVYDGEHLEVWAPSKYRKSIRGLCGNFDGEPDNDFVTPKNCLLAKSDEFASTYAITKSNCDARTIELARKAELSTCVRPSHGLSDVISDVEAGRPSQRGKWGYHADTKDSKRCNSYHTRVVQFSNEICFTIRPVPTCAEGCTSAEWKMKQYQLHCMPDDESARATRRLVEKGANPDFSQKEVSKKHSIKVPLDCRSPNMR